MHPCYTTHYSLGWIIDKRNSTQRAPKFKPHGNNTRTRPGVIQSVRICVVSPASPFSFHPDVSTTDIITNIHSSTVESENYRPSAQANVRQGSGRGCDGSLEAFNSDPQDMKTVVTHDYAMARILIRITSVVIRVDYNKTSCLSFNETRKTT
ncbi:hypothetical protein L798_04841 [Zootermopsis nevadensis]|uniref:Uncharacterized protein n=1 Tax=Zootermopsis nevadensis TaxID=136037 RepID=A0A067RA85_ZOONE|nr:hypothetical protein L798_04841 [Zootermopsis nevadensis]